jgi:hypothetical protein
MSTEDELKEIKDVLLELAKKIDGINALIEQRLIKKEESLADEAEKGREGKTLKKDKTVKDI